MRIVGIAVVGRAQGDDRLQGRRPQGGDLQRVEAAPRDADHADGAAAPGLAGDPVDHDEGVLMLLGGVFVAQQAVGIARAADVDADRGVAVAGVVAVHRLVAQPRQVALAIRQVFEHRRYRPVVRRHRQPDARGEPDAVGHRDPDVLDLLEGAGKLVDDRHFGRIS
jgi:hypothetical protein